MNHVLDVVQTSLREGSPQAVDHAPFPLRFLVERLEQYQELEFIVKENI